MDVPWYCRFCYSANLLEILCGPELNIYSLICDTKDLKDDHTPIAACPQCRKFLKDVHLFRTEYREVDEIINEKFDVKPYNEQSILKNMIDDNLPQMRIEMETINECYGMQSENPPQILDKLHGNSLDSSSLNDKLSTHMMVHMNVNENPYKCNECSYSTVEKRNLKNHIACKHRDEKPFSCDLCGFRCKLKVRLSGHMKIHNKDREKSYKCNECSFATIEKLILQRHIVSIHTDERPFSCHLCDYRCKLKGSLSTHIKNHMNNKKEKRYKCNECSHATIKKAYLICHIASKHSDEKPFACDLCGFRCKLKGNLSGHMKNHMNDKEKPYKCNECSFATVTKHSLINHIKAKHSNEKPFFCNLCDYRCKYKITLSTHMMNHTKDKEKPYKCCECSYATIRKYNLICHIASKHNEEKPFSCNQCDYRSKSKNNLSVHIRRHMNVKKKQYKCSECSVTSVDKYYINRHIRLKHDVKP